jgi:hypothetical protein
MGCPEIPVPVADEQYAFLQREYEQTVVLSHQLAESLERVDKAAFYGALAEANRRNLLSANDLEDRVRRENSRLREGINGVLIDVRAFYQSFDPEVADDGIDILLGSMITTIENLLKGEETE